MTELYRHFDEGERLLYVGISFGAYHRYQAHLRQSHWANSVARIEIERFPNRKAAQKAETVAIKTEMPLHNIKRPPYFGGDFDATPEQDFWASRFWRCNIYTLIGKVDVCSMVFGFNVTKKQLRERYGSVEYLETPL